MPTMMAHKSSLSNGILDSRGRQTPLALVTEWSSESLRVVCHYCTIIMASATSTPTSTPMDLR